MTIVLKKHVISTHNSVYLNTYAVEYTTSINSKTGIIPMRPDSGFTPEDIEALEASALEDTDKMLCTEDLDDLENIEPVIKQTADSQTAEFFRVHAEFFCATGIPQEEKSATEEQRITELNSCLEAKEKLYASDFHFLRGLIRTYSDASSNDEIEVDDFQKTISEIIGMKNENNEAKNIFNFQAKLREKLPQGLDGQIESVACRLLAYREFILAPFENQTTKAELIKFIESNPNIKRRCAKINNDMKSNFSASLLEEYHNAITGKFGYNPEGGLAPTASYHGLRDDMTHDLERLLEDNPELTQFLYNNRIEIAKLAGEFNQFKLGLYADKAIAFFKEPNTFHLFQKICSPEWILTINTDANRAVRKDFIENCIHFSDIFKPTAVYIDIMNKDYEVDTKQQMLDHHLRENPKLSEFIIQSAIDLRSLTNQYHSQKTLVHLASLRPNQPSTPERACKEVYGASPYKATPPKRERPGARSSDARRKRTRRAKSPAATSLFSAPQSAVTPPATAGAAGSGSLIDTSDGDGASMSVKA